eukprot:scaffold408_cov71-Cylindrotheca_fusiformis.AAC.20
MASSNGLRAGAASFQPYGVPAAAAGDQQQQYADAGGYYDVGPSGVDMNDSFAEEMFDALEREIDSAPPAPMASSYAGRVETGLPAHMAAHAAEFWFPECRDCTCCKGFKHGCSCASSNHGICSVCSGVQSAPPPATSTSRAPAAAPSSKPPCKFFASPRGCRFGDSCRFAHAS